MTAIYDTVGEESAEGCHPVDDEDFETITVLCNGTPRRETWKPLNMELIHEDMGKRLVRSDSPWLGSRALIFRPSVVDALGPVLEEYGELLPLSCPEAELFLYNVTRVIDALNEEASTIWRFDDGRIMGIRRYVFRPSVVEGVDIFKIPQLPRACPTFVSQRIVDLWTAAGLRGLRFIPVWMTN